MNPKYWQATALANEVGVHYTTLNNWFNQLEDKRIHYVSRAPDSDRVFDELDLKVALFIKGRRKEKWNLDAIYGTLRDEIETRPFPDDFSGSSGDTQLATVEQIKNMVTQELRQLFEREFNGQISSQITELNGHINSQLAELKEAMALITTTFQAALPAAPTTEEETNKRLEDRNRRVTDLITENRIMTTLKLEALEEWSKLPANERLIKTGIFRREDDAVRREKFVLDYQQKHFEQRVRNEMNP